MIKNYIVIAVVGIAVIGGALFLNKNNATKKETPAPTTQTPSTSSSPSSQPSANNSKTEEAYVELRAQTTYHVQTNNKSNWTAQNEQELFTKYGVTKEEVDAFSKELRNNSAQAKAVTIKQLRRLQELQKEGN